MVVIRYEGPRGGPGMQEMLYPTSYIKSKGLGKACALITDGRFSGGTSGLSIGHISPEAGEGGAIALIEEGDTIVIDIPNRVLKLDISDADLATRRKAMEAKGDKAWKPANRKRVVSTALKAYAKLTTSAALWRRAESGLDCRPTWESRRSQCVTSSKVCFSPRLYSPARRRVLAEPTHITVHVLAKGAKFIGTSMGGVEITIRDADTGELLAKGVPRAARATPSASWRGETARHR